MMAELEEKNKHNISWQLGFATLEHETETSNGRMIELIFRIFKENKRLQHIDLSYTNLDEKAFMWIGRATRRSRSLLGIHLSGNAAVTDEM